MQSMADGCYCWKVFRNFAELLRICSSIVKIFMSGCFEKSLNFVDIFFLYK